MPTKSLLKEYKAALLIIDMQPYFRASNPKFVLDGCKREIIRAKKNKELILLVEYDSCNIDEDSHECLRKLLRSYKHTITIKKYSDDGSREILDELMGYGIAVPKKFRVCGVNATCCVSDTIWGLVHVPTFKAKIGVVKKAVNDETGWKWGWGQMSRMSFGKVNKSVVYGITR